MHLQAWYPIFKKNLIVNYCLHYFILVYDAKAPLLEYDYSPLTCQNKDLLG